MVEYKWKIIRLTVDLMNLQLHTQSRQIALAYISWGTDYCQVKLSLCLTKHWAMKTYWGRGGIAPRVIDLGVRWRWVVSFTPRPLNRAGLYFSRNWLVHLTKLVLPTRKNNLSVFENEVLIRKFGPKTEEVAGEWRDSIIRSFMICTFHHL
jgi:hypothetical protein